MSVVSMEEYINLVKQVAVYVYPISYALSAYLFITKVLKFKFGFEFRVYNNDVKCFGIHTAFFTTERSRREYNDNNEYCYIDISLLHYAFIFYLYKDLPEDSEEV